MKKNKSHIFSLILLSAFPLLLMGGGLFFCCRSTGFGIDKITSSLSYNAAWEIEPLTEGQREVLVQQIFPQTYYYLSSGDQYYAFVSQDQRYVLKFFKMQSLFPKDWFDSFPVSLFKFLGFRQEKSNELFSERIFASYKDAYEFLRNETGLIYIHFNKTREFKSRVRLVDSKGKQHFVDLDAMEFVVQKKVTRIYDHLKELQSRGEEEQLRASIRSFLHLIAVRCQKGFVDQHSSVRNHFGFIENTAIQFDCATLTRDSSMKYPMNFRKEVLEAAERLDAWARVNFPEIALFIQDEAQRLINQS